MSTALRCTYSDTLELFDGQGRTGTLYVYIYVPEKPAYDQHPVIVMSDIGRNQNFNSVTNDCEFYASQIWQRFLPQSDDIVWIEHYPGKRLPDPFERGVHYKGEETFEQLTFGHRTHAMRLPRGLTLDPFHQLGEPDWHPFSRGLLEQLLGVPFPF